MLVSFEKVHFGFNGDSLIENADFVLSENERIGLIGGNGEGTTTLLRLLIGELTEESGKILRKNGIRIGYLAQNGGYDSENTVFEEMHAIFKKDEENILALRKIEEEISSTNPSDSRYNALCSKYEYLNKEIASRDSYNFEVKIRTVLNGMGFENNYHQLVNTMSGGEKTRLQLCRLLLEEPELLILDEPTNHLDTKTLFWLEDYLSTFKGAILTVSHDRYFLDRTVKIIYELENKKLSVFKGNYSTYKILKAEKTAVLIKEYEKQQEERAKMQDYINRNLVRASTTKMAQSRRKTLEKMELVEKPNLPPPPPKFFFSYAEKPAEKVLEVNALPLVAGDKTLIDTISFTLLRGEKCAVLGDNGTGKSTLLKTLIKAKHPSIKVGRQVKIAYYDQENANLDGENRVLDELWARHPLWEQTKVRTLLANAGLFAEDMDKKVKMLSGGERAKLALAVFETENGNALFLDEPTNHLDLSARESLEEALRNFDGTVFFVSHDRYFIKALAGKILYLETGKMSVYNATYDEFTALLREEKATEKAIQPTPAPTKPQNQYHRTKEERAESAKKQTRIKRIEKEISDLETEEAEINLSLTDPKVTADFPLLTEKCNRLEEIKNRLDELYNEYETLL